MKPHTDKFYQTESDVDALQRAHEVHADPKRHEAAKKHAATKLKEEDAKRTRLAAVAAEQKDKRKPSGAAKQSQLEKNVKHGLKRAFPSS